jgi:hypothetical protein
VAELAAGNPLSTASFLPGTRRNLVIGKCGDLHACRAEEAGDRAHEQHCGQTVAVGGKPVRRRQQGHCYFAATGYGFVNGTALANVDARYVEFGRGRDNQCYLAWRNSVPAT